ncbi:olfactory receptor 52B6-like [Gastrophryne carolinensis]
MQNSTSSAQLMLTLTFGEMTDISYLYGAITLVTYLLIIVFNCTVILVVYVNPTLQEPMYVLISFLCANGLYGSTFFFPGLILNLLNKTQSISYPACLTQIFGIYTYVSCEMALLTIMAFDRYVCICNPLRYLSIMNLTKALKLVAASSAHSITSMTLLVLLTIRLPLCDNVILKVYCDNWSLVRLSCIDTAVNNVYGLIVSVELLALRPLLIILSYVEILKVCARSKEFRAKAMHTCTPQLASVLIFVGSCLFEVFLYRYVPTRVPYGLRVFMSVQFLVMTPLLNPLIYGIKITAVKLKIVELICWRNSKASHS